MCFLVQTCVFLFSRIFSLRSSSISRRPAQLQPCQDNPTGFPPPLTSPVCHLLLSLENIPGYQSKLCFIIYTHFPPSSTFTVLDLTFLSLSSGFPPFSGPGGLFPRHPPVISFAQLPHSIKSIKLSLHIF